MKLNNRQVKKAIISVIPKQSPRKAFNPVTGDRVIEALQTSLWDRIFRHVVFEVMVTS